MNEGDAFVVVFSPFYCFEMKVHMITFTDHQSAERGFNLVPVMKIKGGRSLTNYSSFMCFACQSKKSSFSQKWERG